MANLKITELKRESLEQGLGGKLTFNKSSDNTGYWEIVVSGEGLYPSLNIRNNDSGTVLNISSETGLVTITPKTIAKDLQVNIVDGIFPVINFNDVQLLNGATPKVVFNNNSVLLNSSSVSLHECTADTQPVTANDHRVATTEFVKNIATNNITFLTNTEGDAVLWDYDVDGNFSRNAWESFDVSSVVPANATSVILEASVFYYEVPDNCIFRVSLATGGLNFILFKISGEAGNDSSGGTYKGIFPIQSQTIRVQNNGGRNLRLYLRVVGYIS